ncbi:hemolysin family protein [Bacillaceae bacterium W0354]
MTGQDWIYLFTIIILIALTAFFVASEFAIVKIRSSTIESLMLQGNKKAEAAHKVVSHLDEYLSACQLGITITALGLGWIGEPTVESMLRPLFNLLDFPDQVTHFLSFIIAFFLITFLHVVIGELVPKTLAIQKTEFIALNTAKPLIIFFKVMYPFIWILNGSARILTKMFGVSMASDHELAHTEEELRIILSDSYESGEINQSEYKYVNRIFEFDNRLAKEIMVPRMYVEVFDYNTTVEQFLKSVRESKYTRYPVVKGDHDHIIGLINIKQVVTSITEIEDIKEETIESYTRPIIRVIETIPIKQLLKKMQKEHIHMAVLIDEYGGTSGIVTVEDILEEIVGEIQDEFDNEEEELVDEVQPNEYVLDGRILLTEVNELLSLNIDNSDVDTLSGWLLTENPDLREGDTYEYGQYTFVIKKIDQYSIRKVEVRKK